MRVNPNLVPNILADLQQSQSTLNTALQEVSTGKSVNQPSDNPAAAAAMVENSLETGNVDQYTQNVSSVLSMMQQADSVLSSVVTSLTQAVSLGTQGANGTNNASDEQDLAEQVQGILSSVVAAANTPWAGGYLFAGTASTTMPYTADASSPGGYAYNGNDDSNSVVVGDQMSVQVSLPGSQIFSNAGTNVLQALSSLVSALQSGDSSAISAATDVINSALSFVSRQRVFYGTAESRLNAQESWLQQETVALTSQQNSLTGVDMAQAATELSQAETANSAAMEAAARVLPNTLINYLAIPS